MRRKEEGLPAPFLDMAFAIICALFGLILISITAKKTPETGKVVPKAEFMITMDWEDYSSNDIDLHVRAPDGRIVYFSNKTTPLMFLDVDNLGYDQEISLPNGTQQRLPVRREIVTIRAIVPGVYTVNTHFYTRRAEDGSPSRSVVKVQVVKLNPYRIVANKTEILDTKGQEVTMTNFEIGPEGEIVDVYDAQERFIGAKQ
jgi:hypothetical protein